MGELPNRSEAFTDEKSLFGTRIPRPVGGKPHIAIVFLVLIIGLGIALLLPSSDDVGVKEESAEQNTP